MYANILPILCCPQCGAGFRLTESRMEQDEIVEGKIVCGNGHAFSIREGILDFQSQEQDSFNAWTEYIDEDGYDAFDQKLEAQKSDSQRKIENFNQAFGNLPKSLLYFSQDRIKKPSYF